MCILPFFTKLFLRQTRLNVFGLCRVFTVPECPHRAVPGSSAPSTHARSAPPLPFVAAYGARGTHLGAPPLGNSGFPFTVLAKPRVKDTEIKTAMSAQVF